jgi:RimJ/RimL family protein N-acetyltransferase
MLRCSIRNAQMDLRLMTDLSSPAPVVRPSLPAGRFRRLRAADKRHLRAHLLRLHPDDVRHRFMGAMPRRLIDRHVRGLDWQRAVLVGCFIGRSLRGVCELHPIVGNRAEIAISVERRFQGRGIGQALLGRILVLARNRGLTALELRCMIDNQRIRRLVGKFDGKTSFESMEASTTIQSLPPTAATYGTEIAEQAGTIGATLFRFWLGRAQRNWAGRCWSTPDLFYQQRQAEAPSSPDA